MSTLTRCILRCLKDCNGSMSIDLCAMAATNALVVWSDNMQFIPAIT